MKRILFCLVLISSAFGSDLFSLKPTLLSPDEGPDFVPAARLNSNYKKEWDLGRADRFALFESDFKSTVSTKPKFNDENTNLEIRGGLRSDLDSVPAPPAKFPGRGNTSGVPVPLGTTSSFHWGSLDAQVAFAFEGDEPMANKQWTYGGRLNYTPSLAHLQNQWWIPFVWFDYRRVSEVKTTLTAKIGSPAQDYWRFGSNIYWQVPLGPLLGHDSFWKTVKFVPGLQYYRSTDRQLARGDLGDAYYYSAAFDYAIPPTTSWGRKLSAIRFQVSSGRIPPSIDRRNSVSLAVTVRWDQLIK